MTPAPPRRLAPDDLGFVSAVVLAETSWILDTVYGATRAELARAMETLLSADTLMVEHSASAYRALHALRAGADFADAFITAIDRQAGCVETVTFDKSAAERAGMRLLR